MNHVRRGLLRATLPTATLAVALAAGLLRPRSAHASGQEGQVRDSLRALQASNPVQTDLIRLNAPDIAENGASVFINFACALPEVDTLFVFVDRNPQPLVAAYQIAPEVVPALEMRIKVSGTANVWVVARSAGRFYRASKKVTVTAGGCGIGEN
jgi:sulfur-oxidizing protein SoxY